MTTIVGTAALSLTAETARFTTQMDSAARKLNSATARMNRSLMSVQSTMKGFQAGFKVLQGVAVASMAAIAGSAVISIGTDMVKAYSEAQVASANLASSLQSTGRFSQDAMDKLSASALRLSMATQAEDDAIIKATGTFAQFARHLSVPELEQAQKAIVGLSHAMGVDLSQAAVQLGKAVSGASDTIGRTGIKIRETKDESLRLADAVDKTAVFFASAEAAGNTLQGRTVELLNAFGNLEETIGQIISEGLNLQDEITGVRDAINRLNDALNANRDTISGFIHGVSQAVHVVGDLVQATAQGIVSIVEGSVAGIVSAIDFGIQNLARLANYANGLTQNPAGGFLKNAIGMFGGGGFLKSVGNQISALDKLAASSASLSNRWNKNASAHAGRTGLDLLYAGLDFNSIFHYTRPGINFGGGQPSLPDFDMGGGGHAGGGKKAAKTDLEKELEEMKRRAESITESVRTISEVAGDATAEIEKLFNLGFISPETFDRQLKKIKDTYTESLSGTDGFKAVTDGFNNLLTNQLQPFMDRWEDLGSQGVVSDEFRQNLDTVQQVIEGTKTETQELNDEMNRLFSLQAQGFFNSADGAAAFALRLTEIKDRLNEIEVETKIKTDRMSQMWSELADFVSTDFRGQLTDALFGVAQDGMDSFKRFFEFVIEGLSKILIQTMIVNPIADALSGGLKGLIGKGVPNFGFDAGGRILTEPPGRAMGGPVSAHRPYWVGERGPELFMPGASGHIVPNNRMGGQPVINQYFNIHAIDAKGVEGVLRQHAPLIGAIGVGAVQKAYNNRRGMPGPLG